MENLEQLTLDEREEFVASHRRVHCPVVEREAAYGGIARVLKVQQYRRSGKSLKGDVRRFLGQISGLSRAH